MNVDLHRNFVKELAKLPQSTEEQFYKRSVLLLLDRFHPLLGCHPLHGKYQGYWSMNITGDVRALFCIEHETYVFTHIGTHHQLYGN